MRTITLVIVCLLCWLTNDVYSMQLKIWANCDLSLEEKPIEEWKNTSWVYCLEIFLYNDSKERCQVLASPERNLDIDAGMTISYMWCLESHDGETIVVPNLYRLKPVFINPGEMARVDKLRIPFGEIAEGIKISGRKKIVIDYDVDPEIRKYIDVWTGELEYEIKCRN